MLKNVNLPNTAGIVQTSIFSQNSKNLSQFLIEKFFTQNAVHLLTNFVRPWGLRRKVLGSTPYELEAAARPPEKGSQIIFLTSTVAGPSGLLVGQAIKDLHLPKKS